MYLIYTSIILVRELMSMIIRNTLTDIIPITVIRNFDVHTLSTERTQLARTWQ